MTVELIQLRDVTRVYGEGEAAVRALDGIDLDVAYGSFLALMGPSGSGKSTCLHVLGCLDLPTAGSYRFLGTEVTTLDADDRAGRSDHPCRDQAVDARAAAHVDDVLTRRENAHREGIAGAGE